MPTIPLIEIFVRHNADCERQGHERWERCYCRKHLRWSWQGKQYRRTAKTRSWAAAERAKRELELKYEKTQLGKPADDDKVATVEEAIAALYGGQARRQSCSSISFEIQADSVAIPAVLRSKQPAVHQRDQARAPEPVARGMAEVLRQRFCATQQSEPSPPLLPLLQAGAHD